MHRVLFFLKRRAGLDRAEFFRWWLQQHAPIARGLPGLRVYAVCHAIEAEEREFDGLADLTFDDAAAEHAAFASAQGMMARADRSAYAERNERLAVTTYPFVDHGRKPRYKLVSALKRRADLDRPAFKRWWLERHAPMVVQFPELSRYQVSLVEQGDETFADGVAEVSFDSPEALNRVIFSRQVKEVQGDSVVHTSAIYRLLAEVHTIL